MSTKDKSTIDQAPAAPAQDPMDLLLGRFDAFKASHSEQMKALRAQLEANTRAIEEMTSRFGDLALAAPRTPPSEQVPLAKVQIQDILAKRPSASFRLMQDVNHPSFTRTKGAIVRPQTMQTTVWRSLLEMHVKMSDADENP